MALGGGKSTAVNLSPMACLEKPWLRGGWRWVVGKERKMAFEGMEVNEEILHALNCPGRRSILESHALEFADVFA